MHAAHRSATPRIRAAFTLLEAIVAIVILTSVALVCLQLRAQSAAQAARLREHQAIERALDTILTMAEAGLLPDPAGPEEDDPLQRVEWTGEHLGEPYVCTRVREVVANPIADSQSPGANTILVDRYTVEYQGRDARMIRPIRIVRNQRETVDADGSDS